MSSSVVGKTAGVGHSPASLHLSALGSLAVTEFIYYFAFALYIFSYFVGYTVIADYLSWTLLSLMQYASIAFLALKVAIDRLSVRQWLLLAVFLVISYYSYRVTGDKSLIFLCVFVASGRGARVEPLARIAFIVGLIILAFTVTFSLVDGSLEPYGYRGSSPRWSLGYTHPNRLGSSIANIAASFVILKYARGERPRWYNLAALLAAALFVWLVPNSRTSAVVILFTACLLLISPAIARITHVRAFMWSVVAVLCVLAFLSIYCSINYDPSAPWMQALNNAFSNRLYLAHSYLQAFPIASFGHSFSTMGEYTMEGVVIDNAYAKLLIAFGYIPTVFVLTLYFGCLLYSGSLKRVDAFVFGLAIYGALGVAEWQMIHFAVNYCLIGISYWLFGDE